MTDRFKGQTAIVTGGASGIGAAIASRLSSEGADVTIWDLRTGAFPTTRVDLTDWHSVETAAAECATAPDILICSAGITGPNQPTIDYAPSDWRAVFAINVDGIFHAAKALAPGMVSRGYERIVSLASVAGKEGNPNAPAYSASKAAVIGLTKSLGKELSTTGVTVNCIAPAAVETPIFDQMTDAHIAYMKSKIPMGRFGTLEEIASLACWIASPEASFTTAACFDASGGRATY